MEFPLRDTLSRMLPIAFLLLFAPVGPQSDPAPTDPLPITVQDPSIQQGPFIGHVTEDTAKVWARASSEGVYTLIVRDAEGTLTRTHAEALPKNGLCLEFTASGLKPSSAYSYSIEGAKSKPARFKTAPGANEDCHVRLMFASCAREDEATGLTWRQAAKQKPDAVVLLGDTPYIDKTKLAFQRKRYAEFAAFPPMAELLRTTPWYGTWDDHDFGANDIDGRLKGEPKARQAFTEFHANPSYGDGERGIYTKFRRGPVEVFLLDTRTFAATEPSPFLTHHASLLGATQWTWLLDGLQSSTAPIKILACGMIWNGATRPGKQDHWGSYPHERKALFAHIGKHKIPGVTLVGGDIHRSRVIQHASKSLAGYDIIELIVSPMHDGVIASANAPHPGLIKDMGEPQTFLLLDISKQEGSIKEARARFLNAKGKEHFAFDL